MPRPFELVGADALYGQWLAFLKSLQEQGELFLANIHADQHAHLIDPQSYLAAQRPGRNRVCHDSNVQPIEARNGVKKQPAAVWCRKTLRTIARGELLVEVPHRILKNHF